MSKKQTDLHEIPSHCSVCHEEAAREAVSRWNEWGAGLGASIKVRGVPREVPGQGGVMVRVRERSWKDWWKPGGIGTSKAGNYRREVQYYSQVSHEARSREEAEFTCLRAGVSGEHLQEVVMSKLRTEAAPESNREGAVWSTQRKQNTHIQRQESVRFVWGTASACMCRGD